ncbi:PREDICTED: phospholipid phosphatase 6-like [Branchiostoma belcheri]|uniref:Phospholipid phosphatase 6-like n=1 Tax=Branchiostoma belcheri TaxID=7741 RepID=A0A6P4Y4M7_BRABE|nr:PREDICTED: phospholipid phosphatase 6-like [Branchiostoma belcheri]
MAHQRSKRSKGAFFEDDEEDFRSGRGENEMNENIDMSKLWRNPDAVFPKPGPPRRHSFEEDATLHGEGGDRYRRSSGRSAEVSAAAEAAEARAQGRAPPRRPSRSSEDPEDQDRQAVRGRPGLTRQSSQTGRKGSQNDANLGRPWGLPRTDKGKPQQTMGPSDPNATLGEIIFSSLLAIDLTLSKCISVVANRSDSNLRHILIFLEFSCHGVPWIAGTLFMLYKSTTILQVQKLVNLFAALILDLFIVGTMKAMVKRKRPPYNPVDPFDSVTLSVDKFSFPSGHATRSAMVVSFLIGNWWMPMAIKHFLVLWAFAIAMSRVMLGRHHVSDVVTGVVIGLVQYRIVSFFWFSPWFCQMLVWPFLGTLKSPIEL